MTRKTLRTVQSDCLRTFPVTPQSPHRSFPPRPGPRVTFRDKRQIGGTNENGKYKQYRGKGASFREELGLLLTVLPDKNSVNRPDCLTFGIISICVVTWEHILIMNESEWVWITTWNVGNKIHTLFIAFYWIRLQIEYFSIPGDRECILYISRESQCQCRDYGLIKFNGMSSPRQSVQFLSGSNPNVAGKSHIRSESDLRLPQWSRRFSRVNTKSSL